MTPGPTGTVLERDGSAYRVLTPEGELRATLRGRTKRGTPKVVVGDRVTLEPGPTGELWGIASVAERTSLLERRVPEGRGARPVVANVDQVVVVSATIDPEPIPQLLDRLLVVAEANHVPARVVVNKADLAPATALAERFTRAGYEVIVTSTRTGEGLAQLGATLEGKESVVTGPSGVGKSSLLNALEPGFGLRIGAISEKVRRGTNTTVGAVMLPFRNGFVVDTPGFSEVGLWVVPARGLDQCFPEFRELAETCRFTDCRHRAEPGCAVLDAKAAGTLDAGRHASYLAILAELEGLPEEWE